MRQAGKRLNSTSKMRLVLILVKSVVLAYFVLCEPIPKPEPGAWSTVKQAIPKLLAGAATYIAADAVADQISPDVVHREVIYQPAPAAPQTSALTDKSNLELVPYETGKTPSLGAIYRRLMEDRLAASKDTIYPFPREIQELPELKNREGDVIVAETHTSMYIVGSFTVAVILMIIAFGVYFLNKKERRYKKMPKVSYSTGVHNACSAPMTSAPQKPKP